MTRDLSLFGISHELFHQLEAIDAGNSTEETALRVAELGLALTDKVDAVVAYRESIDAFTGILEAKIAELKNRKSYYESKAEKFDEYVGACLDALGRKDVAGQIYKISKRKPSLSVEITDESLVPIEFIHIPAPKPQIMKAELSKLLKAGEIIEGARLVEGKPSIAYKAK